MTDIFEAMARFSNELDNHIKERLPSSQSKGRIEINEFYEMIADYSNRGGKRLRPFLCITSCELFGGKKQQAIPSAVALELFQSFVLIHDDTEDHSDYRRGKSTLHKIYGIEKAINAGDALFYKVWETLLENYALLGPEKCFKIEKEFCKLLNNTLEGQALEIYWNTNKKLNIKEEDYYLMATKKTAWYTVITPCRIGAVIGGGEKYLPTFVKLGEPLGVAFQIQDDLLNLVGEADKYGKEIFGDIYEGKKTLMIAHLTANCTEQEKNKIEKIFNKDRELKTQDEVEQVFELMKKYNSLEYGKKRAFEYAQKAEAIFKKEFANLPQTQAKEYFQNLVDFIVSREL